MYVLVLWCQFTYKFGGVTYKCKDENIDQTPTHSVAVIHCK